jgi:hypothetical protein
MPEALFVAGLTVDGSAPRRHCHFTFIASRLFLLYPCTLFFICLKFIISSKNIKIYATNIFLRKKERAVWHNRTIGKGRKGFSYYGRYLKKNLIIIIREKTGASPVTHTEMYYKGTVLLRKAAQKNRPLELC